MGGGINIWGNIPVEKRRSEFEKGQGGINPKYNWDLSGNKKKIGDSF